MTMDFFELTQETIRNLNKTERQLFDYVVKNMAEVRYMSIRQFARAQFLSASTIFRFIKKLGFSGYTDFINSLLVTSHVQQNLTIPSVLANKNYSEEYLKNAMETVRVISPNRINEVMTKLAGKPNIYILTDDNARVIGQYCEKLFIGLDFYAYFPETSYQMQNLVNRINSKDMILALSYSGQDVVLIDFIERVFITEHPYLLSITRADNNPLENLSDTNFYVFADEIRASNMDLTSSVTMMMVMELLVYEYISRTK